MQPIASYDQAVARLDSARAADPRSIFLVAEVPDPEAASNSRIIAFAVATVESTIPIYRVSEVGFVHDLWVEEPYRHEGIARQMVMLMIERYKQMGVKQIRLETASANEAARALFMTCGFRVSTIEMLLNVE